MNGDLRLGKSYITERMLCSGCSPNEPRASLNAFLLTGGDGYENVQLNVTCENQKRADERLPILLSIPAKHRGFMAAPFIGPVDAEQYLASGKIEEVLCGGENYDGACPCHYEWVKSLSDQCRRQDVTFAFIETGTTFVKGGHTYHIPKKEVQSEQAYKSGLSYQGRECHFNLQPAENTLFQQNSDISPVKPHFRKHCATCGSRMICTGCSNCEIGRAHV